MYLSTSITTTVRHSSTATTIPIANLTYQSPSMYPMKLTCYVYKIMLLCSQATSTAGSSTNASTTSGIDASESLKITCYLNGQYIALL